MNNTDELALVARLRQDVRSGAGLAGAHRRLAAEISAATKVSAGAPRHRTVRGRGAARGRGRLVIAGAVAAAIAVTVAVGYGLLPGRPASTATIPARPGRTTAPATGPARTGPVRTEAELVDYATRAASAAPAFNPGPDEWIYAKIETAASSAGTGGFLFGPPNKRVTSSNWTRVDLSRVASLQHGRIVFTPMLAGTLAGWPNISYRYLESLPTDPAKLERSSPPTCGMGAQPAQDQSGSSARSTISCRASSERCCRPGCTRVCTESWPGFPRCGSTGSPISLAGLELACPSWKRDTSRPSS